MNICTFKCVYTYICAYIYMNICTYKCVYTYIYAYIYMNICTYTYVFAGGYYILAGGYYGVALASRIDKMIGLFCKRAL